jgi:copper chaperone CopZ
MIAAVGSVLAAVLSSACCWLPLLLIAIGASAAGVAGFFEAYRPYFITGAAVLLGTGFYTVYFRQAKCAPESACAAPNRRLRTFSRIMLWTATALVGAFVFFPNYVGYLFAAPTQEAPATLGAQQVEVRYRIEGMTCAGCADILRNALKNALNVETVQVDYPTESALIRYDSDRFVIHEKVVEVAKRAGYAASVASESGQK